MVEKYSKILGEKIAQARSYAGLSRNELAERTGITSKTLNNWEKGTSAPSIPEFINLFEEIGVNPMPYVWELIYGNDVLKDKAGTTKRLHMLIDSMSPYAMQALDYIAFGNHGGSFDSIMQMAMMHSQNTMHDRVMVCTMIATAYDSIPHDPDLPQPDIKMVKHALELGFDAILNDKIGYLNLKDVDDEY